VCSSGASQSSPERRLHIRTAVAERGRAPSLARHPARLSRGGRPPNKGLPYPPDPAHGRGDRRGNPPGRRQRPRRPAGSFDRAAVACGAAHPGGAHRHRARPRRASPSDTGTSRQGWQAPRGRHGPLRLGAPPPLARSRIGMPVGPLLCVIDGPTCGRPLSKRRSPSQRAPSRSSRQCAATVRATPTAPRPRRRPRPRGRAAHVNVASRAPIETAALVGGCRETPATS
jgi:hypothetical protein